MRKFTIDKIESPEEARDLAVDWQKWQAENSMSYAEAIDWQKYFKKLGKKFNLTEEFSENGII